MHSEPRSTTQRRSFVPIALILILALGLALRLKLAPAPGFVPDVAINKGWAQSGAELGIVRSYTEQLGETMLPNYPPLGLLAFVAVGELHERITPPGRAREIPIDTRLIKLPAILFDLATCLVVFALLRRAFGVREGILGALVIALHPAVLYDSAVWGQVDSIFTFFVFAALLAHVSGRSAWTAGLLAVGVLCKLQALIFFPLAGLLLVRKPRALAIGTALGCVIAAFVLAPFVADEASRAAVIGVYTHSVGFYPTLTSSSYNLWWILFGDLAGQKLDHDLLFGLVTYRTASLLLFGSLYAGILATLWPSLWARDERSRFAILAPFLAGGLVVSAFFLFCTQMHERYLFPSMVLSLPLVFLGRRGAVLYALHSAGFLFNLLGSLPYGAFDRALYAEFPLFEVVVAAWQVLVFVLIWRYVLRMQAQALPESARSLRLRWKELATRYARRRALASGPQGAVGARADSFVRSTSMRRGP